MGGFLCWGAMASRHTGRREDGDGTEDGGDGRKDRDGGMDEPKSAVQRFTWEGVLGDV